MLVTVVVDGVVLGGAVVPDCDVAYRPAPAHGVFQAGDVAFQQLEQVFRIRRRVTQQLLDEVAQHQRAFATLGMHPHHRMLGLVEGGGEDFAIAFQACLGGIEARGIVIVVGMQRPQLVGQLAQRRWQVLVGLGGIGPDRVAAGGRDHHRAQDRGLWVGHIEGHVGMPGVGAPAVFGIQLQQVAGAVAHRHRGMRHQLAPELAEGFLAGIVEVVLATEEQHLVTQQRGAHSGKGGRGQIGRQTDVAHFRADAAGDRMDLKQGVRHGGSPCWLERWALRVGISGSGSYRELPQGGRQGRRQRAFRLERRLGQTGAVVRELVQHLLLDAGKAEVGAVTRMGQRHRHDTAHAARARFHHHHLVAQVDRFFHVMGHQDHGDALGLPDAVQLLLQVGAGHGVKRTEGLVQQQDLGFTHQRAGNGHALRHATRQLVRIGCLETLQAHQGDMLAHRLALLRSRAGRIEQTQFDIAFHRQPGEQAMLLEHDATLQAGTHDALAIQQHLALVLVFQSHDQAQQGGLAATAGADDADELARCDVQRHILQHGQLAVLDGIRFTEVLDFQRTGLGHLLSLENSEFSELRYRTPAPGQQAALDARGEPVQGKADEAHHQHAEDHQIHQEQFTPVDHGVADALARDQQVFRAQRGQPGIHQGQVDASQDGRRGCRQHQLGEPLAAAELEHAGGLDQFTRHAADTFEGVEHHGKERRQRQEGHLGRIAQAEPHRQQRDPGKQRDLLHGMEGRPDHAFEQPRQAEGDTEGQSGRHANGQADEVAPQAGCQGADQVATEQLLHGGVPHLARGHQQRRAGPVQARRQPPQQHQRNGQHPAAQGRRHRVTVMSGGTHGVSSKTAAAPAEQDHFDTCQHLVTQVTHHAHHRYGGNDHIQLEQLAPEHDHVAQPLGGRQQLHHHQRQPGMREAIAHAVPDRRQRRREDHPPQQLPARKAQHPRHLDIAGRHVLDTLVGVDCDGHQRRLGDEDDLERLVDAHQQHQQGQPAQHRHLAEGLEEGIDIVLEQRRQAHDHAQQQAAGHAHAKAQQHAQQADAQVVEQFARLRQVDEGGQYRLRRGQHLRRDPAQLRGHGPQRQQAQREGERQPERGVAAEEGRVGVATRRSAGRGKCGRQGSRWRAHRSGSQDLAIGLEHRPEVLQLQVLQGGLEVALVDPLIHIEARAAELEAIGLFHRVLVAGDEEGIEVGIDAHPQRLAVVVFAPVLVGRAGPGPEMQHLIAVDLVGSPLGRLDEDLDHARRGVGIVLGELLGHQHMRLGGEDGRGALAGEDDAGGVLVAQAQQVDVAEGGIDVLGRERRQRGGLVQVDGAQLALLQAVGFEYAVDGQLRIGALEDGHALAAQVLDRLDRRIRWHRQVDVGAHAGGQHQLGLETSGTCHDGRQVALEGEVQLLVAQCLVHRRTGALEEEPLDLDAVGLEFLFDPALGIGHRRRTAREHRWIADARLRHADADDIGPGRRGAQGQRGQGEQGGAAQRQVFKEVAAIRLHGGPF
eukprot:TRINITY_DN1374_c0_g5_i1.p2 TRINITY_DN1374_c0_g5~~TRINITY_DN1374_c0_g5_i1.p2  ORF type:complete len:1491 (+),score=638.18 TRINITY_DN1374_c0_g5_i1:28616-33088(+)